MKVRRSTSLAAAALVVIPLVLASPCVLSDSSGTYDLRPLQRKGELLQQMLIWSWTNFTSRQRLQGPEWREWRRVSAQVRHGFSDAEGRS